jgi:hypothetical protein
MAVSQIVNPLIGKGFPQLSRHNSLKVVTSISERSQEAVRAYLKAALLERSVMRSKQLKDDFKMNLYPVP